MYDFHTFLFSYTPIVLSLSVWCVTHCTVPVPDLKEMCELLGIDQSVLERAFSFRTVEAKMEKVSTTLNVAQVDLPHIFYHTLSL